ncbi:hypothetical protein [Streptomyces sp. NBC_00140]|uniref:hypothetical protein n=1 Tax=Streptomyces sp. NBC_00140 TaxID=2975664 RepID=UPI002256C4F9|nr:hypothetical protein [Streptomyces sp. NBC_00140]MCX5338115.1 hypothetical protein [Streptomyces sp. NBC_00140]
MSSDQTRTWIRRASTAAGLAYTAIAEYELARRLGARAPIAVMLPMSIDCYVIAALKWFRPLDVALSLILMCAAQVAAHALEAGVVHVTLELVTVVSLLVPVALWRTHALARNEDDAPRPPAVEYAAAVEVERAPEAYPAIEAQVPAVPEAVPAGVRLLPIVARPDTGFAAPVFAAEETRTRTGVHAEYVPEPAAGAITQTELDDAALLFKDELLAGKIPGIARIKSECRVGQDKAKEIQDGLRQAQAAWSLAGSGATS